MTACLLLLSLKETLFDTPPRKQGCHLQKQKLLNKNKKEFCVKNKYILEFDFNELKMLQEAIEKMHYDEFYTHWLSEFLKSKLQTLNTKKRTAK